MHVYETQLQIPVPPDRRDLIPYLQAQTLSQLGEAVCTIRFVINQYVGHFDVG